MKDHVSEAVRNRTQNGDPLPLPRDTARCVTQGLESPWSLPGPSSAFRQPPFGPALISRPHLQFLCLGVSGAVPDTPTAQNFLFSPF